jgi:hypothetical protein
LTGYEEEWSMLGTSEREAIQPGERVTDSEGNDVGPVVAVFPDYLCISRGEFWPTNSYVPWSEVRGREGDRIILDIAGAQVRSRWG